MHKHLGMAKGHMYPNVPSGGRRDQKIQVKGKGRWQELDREAARPVPGMATPGTGCVPGLRAHLYPTWERRPAFSITMCLDLVNVAKGVPLDYSTSPVTEGNKQTNQPTKNMPLSSFLFSNLSFQIPHLLQEFLCGYVLDSQPNQEASEHYRHPKSISSSFLYFTVEGGQKCNINK